MDGHFDIGISTGAYAELPLAATLWRIAELAPSAEICSWGYHSLLDSQNAHAVQSIGLPFSVHGPIMMEGLGSRSRARHRAALDVHRRHVAAAAELGASLYVVHPDMQRRRRPWNPKVVDTLQRSFEELRILQGEMGVSIVVENLPFNGRSHYVAPGDLDLRGLGLALDVGHAAATGTLGAWLDDPQADLRHVHLHSNPGYATGDLHHPLGTGVVDVGRVLEVARAAGATIVLEHFGEADIEVSLEHLYARGLLLRSVG